MQSSTFTEFYSNDLSSLIRSIVLVNSRPEKIESQEKLIESIEHLLKPKFGPAKAYLIGSHAYKIAKGGLATVDFHLDLRKLTKKCFYLLTIISWNNHLINPIISVSVSVGDSFHTDKIKSVDIILGMNETQKIMEKSEEWSDVGKSEHSKYAILSAEHIVSKKRCHFTFGTGVAVKNTEIVDSLFAAQPVGKWE